MKKQSNILDFPKPSLDPLVWEKSQNLKPEVKEFILGFIHSFAKANNLRLIDQYIDDVKFVGSLTTNCWNANSDMDIHIVVDLPKFVKIEHPEMSEQEASDFLDGIRKQVDQVKAKVPGTEHPTEIYFENEFTTIANQEFSGSYSVLNDEWIKYPHIVDQTFDIEKLHPDLLNLAKETASELDAAFGEIKRDVQDIKELQDTINDWPAEQRSLFEKKLQKRLDDLEVEIQGLIDLREDVAEKRKHYKAMSEQEVRFKYLQKYFYMHVLTDLKTLLKQSPDLSMKDIPVVENIMQQASLNKKAGAAAWVDPSGKEYNFYRGTHLDWIDQNYALFNKQYGFKNKPRYTDDLIQAGWSRIGDLTQSNLRGVEVKDIYHVPEYIFDYASKQNSKNQVAIEDLERYYVELTWGELGSLGQKAVNKALSQKRMGSLKLSYQEDDNKILVDFDGTIAEELPDMKVGEPMEGVKEALAKLQEMGYEVVIFSARADNGHGEDEVKNYLDSHEIPYDSIFQGEKPIARFQIDDRAIHFDNWNSVLKQIEHSGKTANLNVEAVDAFYHGGSGASIRQMAKDGYVAAPVETGKGHQSPLAGRSYLTKDLGYALIYALGGDMIGQDATGYYRDGDEGGIVLVAPNEDTLIPDEDWLGEKLTSGYQGESNPIYEKLQYQQALAPVFNNLKKYNPKNSRLYDMSYQSMIGKMAIRILMKYDPSYLKELTKQSHSLSHEGNLKVLKAWVFDKTRDNPKLKKDGSNFFDIAQEIPVVSERVLHASLSQKYWIAPDGKEFPFSPTDGDIGGHLGWIPKNKELLKGYGINLNIHGPYGHNEVAEDMIKEGWVRITTEGEQQFSIELADLNHIPSFLDNFVAKHFNTVEGENGIGIELDDSKGRFLSVTDPFPSLQQAANKARKQPVMAALSLPVVDPKTLNRKEPYALFIGTQMYSKKEGLDLFDIFGEHPMITEHNRVPTVTLDTLVKENIPVIGKAARAGDKQPIQDLSGVVKTAQLGSDYDFSSTHFLLPKELSEKIVRWAVETIPEQNIVYDEKDPGTKGIQLDSHITLKYGLKTNDFEEVKKALEGEKAPHIKFGKTSFFEPEGKDYDVIIITVDSEDLQKLNEKLCSQVECEDTQFKEYHPHVTVAYIQKGLGKKFDEKDIITGEELNFDKLIFSPKEGEKRELGLGKVTEKESSFMPSNTDLAPSDDWAGTVGYPTNESMDAPQNVSDEETWYSPENDRPRTKTFWEKMIGLFMKQPLSTKEPVEKDVVPVKEASTNKEADYTNAYWIDPNGKVYQVRGNEVTTEDMNEEGSSTHTGWIENNLEMLKRDYGIKYPDFERLMDAGWIRIGDAFGTDWGITVKDLNHISSSVDNLLAQFAPEGAVITVAPPSNYGANYTFEWPVKSIQQTVNSIKNRKEYYQKEPVHAKQAKQWTTPTEHVNQPGMAWDWADYIYNYVGENWQEFLIGWMNLNPKNYVKPVVLIEKIYEDAGSVSAWVHIEFVNTAGQSDAFMKLIISASIQGEQSVEPEGREFSQHLTDWQVDVVDFGKSDELEKTSGYGPTNYQGPSVADDNMYQDSPYHMNVTWSPEEDEELDDQNGAGGYPNRFFTRHRGPFYTDEGKVLKMLEDTTPQKQAVYRGNMDIWLAPDGQEYSTTSSHTAWIVNEEKLLQRDYGLTLPTEGTPEDDNLIAWLISKGWVRVSGVLPVELDLLVFDIKSLPVQAERFVWKYKPEIVIVEDLKGNDTSFDKEEYSKGLMKKAAISGHLVNDVLALIHSSGGSTYNLSKGNLIGTNSFAVAIYPDREQIVPEVDYDNLEGYLTQNEDLLNNPSNSFGAWVSNGKTYFDVVATVSDKNDAMILGQQHGQPAIFDLKSMKEIPLQRTASLSVNAYSDRQQQKDYDKIFSERWGESSDKINGGNEYYDYSQLNGNDYPAAKDLDKERALLDQLENPADRNMPTGLGEYAITYYDAMPAGNDDGGI